MTVHDARRDVTCLETYSGIYIDYLNPRPEDIELADIARGLSQVCRFAGQTSRFYSVAEHGLYVMRLIPPEKQTPEFLLAALHHDSHEAYLGDWPSPLKYVMGSRKYKTLKHRLDAAIAEAFELDVRTFSDPIIKAADIEAMRHEAATLKWSHGADEHWGWTDAVPPLAGVGWDPDKAEREFLKAHEELMELR